LDISGNQGHFGGGFYCISSDSTNIDRTSFRNNTSETGGAIYCVASSPLIKNTKIINNTADVGGGLYIIENSHPILQNVEISENIALDDVLGGGAILSYQSNPTLINTTIIYNSAVKKGGGLYSIGSDPILINTIMWDNSPEEIFLHEWSIYPNTITTLYCDISGGEEGVISNVYDTIFWLEGNIDEDPLFVGGWEHPYAISKGSPCKDAGTPDTAGLFLPVKDIDGGPRIWNNRIDIGAYEWNNVGFEDRQTFVSDLRIQTYPNPFTDNLTIEFGQMQSGNITLTLLNQLGQQVAVLFSGNWQDGTFSFDVDGSRFPSGIYLIRLQAGDRTSVKKIVKW